MIQINLNCHITPTRFHPCCARVKPRLTHNLNQVEVASSRLPGHALHGFCTQIASPLSLALPPTHPLPLNTHMNPPTPTLVLLNPPYSSNVCAGL